MTRNRWVAASGALCGMIAASHGSATSAFRLQISAPRNPPNVLFVTLDTTRADRMGFLGSSRGLTPTLDALARQSTVFTRAYAQAPITPVSHATLLTGMFPPAHKVTDFGDRLPASVPYLPALLKARGYHTAAFVGALVLDPREGTAPGFDRAFDVYDAGFRIRRPGEDRYRTVERRGSEVVARTLTWLGAGDRSPYFLWVHLYDPHDPYDPPAEMKRRFPSALYDAEIAEVDRLVGLLLNRVGPSALVVVAADHGEALGDHGEETHGVFLYDATLHVPLLIRLPNQRGFGAKVTSRVRLADVVPTVLEAAGAPIPSAVQGQALGPLLTASGGSDRPVYAETEYPRRAFGWSPLAAWRTDRFLFIRAPRRELYDVVADPGAVHNIAESRSRVADGLDAELRQFIGGPGGSDPKSRVDPDLARRLASLGYVAGSGSGQSVAGTDPKDRISVANALQAAVRAVEDGAFQKAVPLLERVTTEEPTIQMAQLQLGVARARQRQYAQAIGPLQKAIALQPDAMIAHYELGVALYETGDLKTSAAHFEIVASHMPKWADARFSLGSVYARIDRVPDAENELKAALDLAPRHFRANLLLGRLYTLQGRAAHALPLLQAAVDVQRSSAEAHRFLADAYEKLGRVAEAEQERQRAKLGK